MQSPIKFSIVISCCLVGKRNNGTMTTTITATTVIHIFKVL